MCSSFLGKSVKANKVIIVVQHILHESIVDTNSTYTSLSNTNESEPKVFNLKLK